MQNGTTKPLCEEVNNIMHRFIPECCAITERRGAIGPVFELSIMDTENRLLRRAAKSASIFIEHTQNAITHRFIISTLQVKFQYAGYA